jgi:hypothetical protein
MEATLSMEYLQPLHRVHWQEAGTAEGLDGGCFSCLQNSGNMGSACCLHPSPCPIHRGLTAHLHRVWQAGILQLSTPSAST